MKSSEESSVDDKHQNDLSIQDEEDEEVEGSDEDEDDIIQQGANHRLLN